MRGGSPFTPCSAGGVLCIPVPQAPMSNDAMTHEGVILAGADPPCQRFLPGRSHKRPQLMASAGTSMAS